LDEGRIAPPPPFPRSVNAISYQSKVVDRYNPDKPNEGQIKEQLAIKGEGGIGNLDNKINAMAQDKFRDAINDRKCIK
jgi:hypothetical protein